MAPVRTRGRVRPEELSDIVRDNSGRTACSPSRLNFSLHFPKLYGYTMVDINGFYYPDRCENCAFIQRSLRVFEDVSREQTGPRGESAIDEMRAARQTLFDIAEYLCSGTLTYDPDRPADCQLMPSFEQSNEQLKDHT